MEKKSIPPIELRPLLDERLITEEQVTAASERSRSDGKVLAYHLIKLGLISEEALLEAWARAFKLPILDRESAKIDVRFAERVAGWRPERKNLVPVRLDGRKLVVAVVPPLDWDQLDGIRFATGYQVDPYLISPLQMEQLLARIDAIPASPAYSLREEAAEEDEPTKPLALVRVFFGTDREKGEPTHCEANPRSPPLQTFRNGRGTRQLTYGAAQVSIPSGHRRGKMERPFKLLGFSMPENLDRHMVIWTCLDLDEERWKKSAGEDLNPNTRAALVFVHGFNVSFDDAIRRAAQIGFDLAFDGIIAAYSWSSEFSVRGYPADEDNVRLTVPHLKQFLSALHAAGARTIHIIAHSMGNRAVIEALTQLGAVIETPGVIGEVILAAPDIDADILRQAVAELSGKARRYTLYGSEADTPLKISKAMRQGYPRAGDGGENLFVAHGIETIEATSVGEDLLGLGHSYFADKRPVLDDIYYVIREALPPWRRAGLHERDREGLKYWVFQQGT